MARKLTIPVLINLLIEERAKLLRARDIIVTTCVLDRHRDQARREIEGEVIMGQLSSRNTTHNGDL